MQTIDIILFACVAQYFIVGAFIWWMIRRQKKMKKAVDDQKLANDLIEYSERPFIEII